MQTMIACVVAGICAAGFVTIWFATVYKELTAKRNSLTDLEDQLHLHKLLSSQARVGLEARSAAKMLETSRMLCREAAKSYNRVLRKPIYRIPALLMGFRAYSEQKQPFD